MRQAGVIHGHGKSIALCGRRRLAGCIGEYDAVNLIAVLDGTAAERGTVKAIDAAVTPPLVRGRVATIAERYGKSGGFASADARTWGADTCGRCYRWIHRNAQCVAVARTCAATVGIAHRTRDLVAINPAGIAIRAAVATYVAAVFLPLIHRTATCIAGRGGKIECGSFADGGGGGTDTYRWGCRKRIYGKCNGIGSGGAWTHACGIAGEYTGNDIAIGESAAGVRCGIAAHIISIALPLKSGRSPTVGWCGRKCYTAACAYGGGACTDAQ